MGRSAAAVAVNKRDPIGLQNVNCHPSTEFPATVRLGLTHDDAGSWRVFVTGRGLPADLPP